MSNQLRYKGKFVKKINLDQKMKQIAARVKKSSEDAHPNLCQGLRILDLNLLGKNLKCHKCHQVLSLENIIREAHLGINSALTIKCLNCDTTKTVRTGKTHVTNTGLTHSDVNSRAVLGK